jgi:hypothetical protein
LPAPNLKALELASIAGRAANKMEAANYDGLTLWEIGARQTRLVVEEEGSLIASMIAWSAILSLKKHG